MSHFAGSAWDPLYLDIERARHAGWHLVPQAGLGWCENALVRHVDGLSDLVTLPALGHSTVVRLEGGPEPGFPREPGRELWRHQLLPSLALDWLLTGPCDEQGLVRRLSQGQFPMGRP